MKIRRFTALTSALLLGAVVAARADSALKIELRGPRRPVVIAQSQFDALRAVAEAEEERQILRKSWKGTSPTKTERKRMRELDTLVEKGRNTIQGISLKLRLTNTGNTVTTCILHCSCQRIEPLRMMPDRAA